MRKGCSVDKTLVFIDGVYLYRLAKLFYTEGKFSFVQFALKIAESLDLSCEKVFVYYGASSQSKVGTRIIEEKAGISGNDKVKLIVRSGLMISKKRKLAEKGVDTLLTMDLMLEPFKENVKKIIVVTGDSDFVPVLDYVRSKGVKITLCSTIHTAEPLLKACDRHLMLNDSVFNEVPPKAEPRENPVLLRMKRHLSRLSRLPRLLSSHKINYKQEVLEILGEKPYNQSGIAKRISKKYAVDAQEAKSLVHKTLLELLKEGKIMKGGQNQEKDELGNPVINYRLVDKVHS